MTTFIISILIDLSIFDIITRLLATLHKKMNFSIKDFFNFCAVPVDLHC